jgi:hypothetical protein
MNLNTIVNLVYNRVRDEKREKYTPDFIIEMLNVAQRELVMKVNSHITQELITSVTATVTSGQFTVNVLTDILNGFASVLQIRIPSGRFLRKITLDQYRQYVNKDYTWNTNFPMWYYKGDVGYVFPTDISSVLVYYRKKPTDLDFDSMGSGSCLLEEPLHFPLILLTSSLIGGHPEAGDHYKQAMSIIDDINASSAPSDIFDYDLQPEEDPEYYGNEESFTNFLSLYEPE